MYSITTDGKKYNITEFYGNNTELTVDQANELFEFMEHEFNLEDVENNYDTLDKALQVRLCDLWEKKIRQQENKYELLDLAYDELMQEIGL